jgi:hypothetical protein
MKENITLLQASSENELVRKVLPREDNGENYNFVIYNCHSYSCQGG